MKKLLVISSLFLSSLCFSGSHGTFDLSCVSDSLRTHMFLKLNDNDFIDSSLQPQLIILSVMGHISIFEGNTENNPIFKVRNQKPTSFILSSTDKEESHIFNISFEAGSSAKVTIVRADNPRTNKKITNLSLECSKLHNL